MFASLKNRVVLVTGGARGLGREMALALADAGARVAITGNTPSAALADTLRAGGSGMIALDADVRDYGACAEAVAAVEARLGPLQVLVNNAGRGMLLVSDTFNVAPALFWKADPEAWRTIVDVNVTGAFNMARAATPGMVARGFGKIVNISTSDQTMVRKGYSPYGPSKAALEAASRIWAQDLAGTGVDVNVYLPGGAADTDLLPPSQDRRGADGNLLPAAIMRRGILWLCADQSNGRTGGRYNARLWDEALAPDDAAAGARSLPVDKPAIM